MSNLQSLPGRDYAVDTPLAGGVEANEEAEDDEDPSTGRKRTRARGHEGDDIAEEDGDGGEKIDLSHDEPETTRRKLEVIGTVKDEEVGSRKTTEMYSVFKFFMSYIIL